MEKILLTMLVSLILGYIFLKLKIPGGLMVGSIVASTILNISTGLAYMPPSSRVLAQLIAGAFIAIGLEKSDLYRLKHIFKPALVLIAGMLILNIISGFLIYYTSSMDLTTSFMSAVPGGMSDIPIISEEMGADSSKVTAMQFIRMVFGIGVFPYLISKVSQLKYFKDEEIENEIYKRITSSNNSFLDLLITMGIASVFGIIGKWTGIPSATLVFSMISTMVFKLTTNRGSMPRWMRRFAQVLSGAYIGSSIEMKEIIELKYLIIPAFLLIMGYLVACFLIGGLIHKKFDMPMNEAMLAATPAGASDMALISADIGIESADVIVLQIIRLVTVVSIFPQIIRFIVSILE